MKYTLADAISSIVNACGRDIIDNKDAFLDTFKKSAPLQSDKLSLIETAFDQEATMILLQAVNDDDEGQRNACTIAIEILMATGAPKDSAIELVTAFAVALGFKFGAEKSDDELIEDAKAHLKRNENQQAENILKMLTGRKNQTASYFYAYLLYKKEAFKQAIEILNSTHMQNNADGLYLLGSMYIAGNGCEKSTGNALKAWERASELGHTSAQYNTAMVYLNGLGVEKDDIKARSYLMMAAKQGFAPAVTQLTKLTGSAAPAVSEDTFLEIKKLADTGDINAIYNLANCYFKGTGTAKDKQKAIDLYTIAAKSGHYASMLALITRYTQDKDVQKAWSAALYWYKKAVKADKKKLSLLHPAIVRGEETYNSVINKKQNKKDALEEAGKQGYITAYTAIANMYRDDRSLPYLKLAADAGDLDALATLVNDYKDESYRTALEYVSNIMNDLN